jgi:hypothetical protein
MRRGSRTKPSCLDGFIRRDHGSACVDLYLNFPTTGVVSIYGFGRQPIFHHC